MTQLASTSLRARRGDVEGQNYEKEEHKRCRHHQNPHDEDDEWGDVPMFSDTYENAATIKNHL